MLSSTLTPNPLTYIPLYGAFQSQELIRPTMETMYRQKKYAGTPRDLKTSLVKSTYYKIGCYQRQRFFCT